MARVRVRSGQPSVALTRDEFRKRFLSRFQDPAFATVESELERVLEVAWDGYHRYRKSPNERPAGPGFADPAFPLPVEWLETRAAIAAAQRQHAGKRSRSRILVINGSSRSDQTCPGEMSKTFRLVRLVEECVKRARGFEVDRLDLSLLASEYGRTIHPCKACVSTAMPLCHWPCSCYPNHAMGQTGDWMSEIYPRWVAAHGVLVLCPVNWYQAPSGLKLMMDRLVCADGGNPDPTLTRGKDPLAAKRLEMQGWSYPRHLAGRAFAVVVHGDVAGVEDLRRILVDWLTDMGLVPSGRSGAPGAYVGYQEPYATSHDALDRDRDFQQEVRHAALSLIEMVRLLRSGRYTAPDRGLAEPRPR